MTAVISGISARVEVVTPELRNKRTEDVLTLSLIIVIWPFVKRLRDVTEYRLIDFIENGPCMC